MRRDSWPPPPPANLWIVVVGALWCVFLIQAGYWLAKAWP